MKLSILVGVALLFVFCVAMLSHPSCLSDSLHRATHMFTLVCSSCAMVSIFNFDFGRLFVLS